MRLEGEGRNVQGTTLGVTIVSVLVSQLVVETAETEIVEVLVMALPGQLVTDGPQAVTVKVSVSRT